MPGCRTAAPTTAALTEPDRPGGERLRRVQPPAFQSSSAPTVQGEAGFVQVLDEYHLAYPEYRGNGVMASLGNISENPQVGLLMVDFVRDLIGPHINGTARIVEDDNLRAAYPSLPIAGVPGRRAALWVVVEVEEVHMHP